MGILSYRDISDNSEDDNQEAENNGTCFLESPVSSLLDQLNAKKLDQENKRKMTNRNRNRNRKRNKKWNLNKNNNNNGLLLITGLSDFDDEAMESAIFLSLNTSLRKRKIDKKNKGVISPCTLTPLPWYHTFYSKSEVGSTSSPGTCLICCDIVVSRITITRCKHMFCQECISDYITKKLKDDIHTVTCPGLGCNVVLNENAIKCLVPKQVCDRLLAARTEGSVLAFTCFIKCPMEGCGRKIVNDERDFRLRACTWCWKIFCFNCMEGCHMGMTCDEYRQREEIARKKLALIRETREKELKEKKITKKITTVFMEDNGKKLAFVFEEKVLLSYIKDGLIIQTGAGLRFNYRISDLLDTDTDLLYGSIIFFAIEILR